MWKLKYTHLDVKETYLNYSEVANLCVFCCCMLYFVRFVYMQVKVQQSSLCIFFVCDISACPPARNNSWNAAEALETLRYEKWSSTSFFYTTLCVTRRLESEALWRKHSCSRHLCCSCNIHWNHTTLTVGLNYFLLEKTPKKPSPWKLRCDRTALYRLFNASE